MNEVAWQMLPLFPKDLPVSAPSSLQHSVSHFFPFPSQVVEREIEANAIWWAEMVPPINFLPSATASLGLMDEMPTAV